MKHLNFRYAAGAVAIAVGVAAAALWPNVPETQYKAGPFELSAVFTPDPPKPGKNTLVLSLRDSAGELVSGATISGLAVMPAMGQMAEMRSAAAAKDLGGGRYRLEFDLAMAGSWPLTLSVKAPDGKNAELAFNFKTGIPVTLTTASGAGESERTVGQGVQHYTCPMHPSVHSEEPGQCPVCSMDLTPVTHDDAHGADMGGVATGETGVSHYTCSMHPSVRSEDPGTCPICAMDLTPVTHEEVQSGTIFVDSLRRQLIGVKTAPVAQSEVIIPIRAVGRITYDETRLTDITLKYKGWVGEVYADYPGVAVVAGEPLFSVYAPELLSAQEEFLESSRRSGAGGSSVLLKTAQRRLRLWNISEDQIGKLVKAGEASEYLPILSPVSGTVINKNIVDGTAVDAGELLYRVADLTNLWVEADIYEEDLPLVKVGQSAELTLSYLPGTTFQGTISYIYPYLDTTSRTARVRVEVPNPTGELKPDMYANVELKVPLGEHLVVPEEAVVMAGKTNRVFVDLGEGKLKPRKVTLGRKSEAGFIVLDGLGEGETVVTSGNFLIAAESKLKAGVDQW